MKHLTVVFTLCFALATLPAFSNPILPDKPGNVLLKTRTLDQHALQITLANLEKQDTRVRLKTLDGKRVFFVQAIRKHNGYSIRVDLQPLGDGKFILEVEQNDEMLHQVIVVENNKMLFSKVVEGEAKVKARS